MKTVEQRSPVQYSPRRQSMWVLADYGGKQTMVERGVGVYFDSPPLPQKCYILSFETVVG